MEDGYVKLYRRLIESRIFCQPIDLKIWIWLLLKASYKTQYTSFKIGKGEVTVKVKRGQLIYGRKRVADELQIPSSTIERHLRHMVTDEAIIFEAHKNYSIITICNFDVFNDKDSSVETVTGITLPINPLANQIVPQVDMTPIPLPETPPPLDEFQHTAQDIHEFLKLPYEERPDIFKATTSQATYESYIRVNQQIDDDFKNIRVSNYQLTLGDYKKLWKETKFSKEELKYALTQISATDIGHNTSIYSKLKSYIGYKREREEKKPPIKNGSATTKKDNIVFDGTKKRAN